jgi:hypothetical protein
VKEIGQIYHFGNFTKTKVTVVDNDYEKKSLEFKNTVPNINKVIKIKYKTVNQCFKNFADIKDVCLTFVSGTNDTEVLVQAKRLRQLFFDKNFEAHNTQVELLMKHPKIIALLTEFPEVGIFFDKNKYWDLLGITSEQLYLESVKKLVDNNDISEKIAIAIHSLYCRKMKQEVPWDTLTDEKKDMNRWAARHFMVKLRLMGAKLVKKEEDGNEIAPRPKYKTTLQKLEHTRWNAEKWLTGFIPGKKVDDNNFAPILKNNLKWHSAMVSWKDLPNDEKEKDEALTDIGDILRELKDMKIIATNKS